MFDKTFGLWKLSRQLTNHERRVNIIVGQNSVLRSSMRCEKMIELRIVGYLILPLLSLGSASCGEHIPATPKGSVAGIKKNPSAAIDDLTTLGFCSRRYGADTCTSTAAGIDRIAIRATGSTIETVEITINFGFRRDQKFVDATNNNAIRLIRYFMPDWKDNTAWTTKSIDHSRRAYCPRMINVGHFSVVISLLQPASIPGVLERLTITKKEYGLRSAKDFDFDNECDYETGRFIEEKYNQPFQPYIS